MTMSGRPSIDGPIKFENPKEISDIFMQAKEMESMSFEKMEPIHSKYNLLQMKPRKSRSMKHHVLPSDKMSDKKECSIFNDPKVQEQLQNLILDVFAQKDDDKKSYSNNECEKYSTEFEKFTSNKRESILRFPYLVDRVSTKSSISIRQSQSSSCGPFLTNQHSRHNIESKRPNQECQSRKDDCETQTACKNLCNDLMKTIDSQLNSLQQDELSPSAYCQSEGDRCVNLELSNKELFKSNSNIHKIPNNKKDDEMTNSGVREESQQNSLQTVKRGSTDSVNRSLLNVRSFNGSSTNVSNNSCTKIDRDKKKQFLDVFFGYDKMKNQSSFKPPDAKRIYQVEKENSSEHTQSTFAKLSVPNEDSHPHNNNHCNCSSNNCRSNSKISDLGNFEKCPTSADRTAEKQRTSNEQHNINVICSKDAPDIYNGFPSEGSNLTSKNTCNQVSKEVQVEKNNDSPNIKNNFNYNDFSYEFNHNGIDKLPRSLTMNNEYFDFDPQLSFLLERQSNSFPPSSNLVDQSVYFCGVSNDVPCNLQLSESGKYPNSYPNIKKMEPANRIHDKAEINITDNSFLETSNTKQVNNQSATNQCSNIENEDYFKNDKYKIIYKESNDARIREKASFSKPSYDEQNDRLLQNETSCQQSFKSCTCSKISNQASSNLTYYPSNMLNKESTLRNASYGVGSSGIDGSPSNTDNQSNMKIKNYLENSSDLSKGMTLSQLISLDEPDYLQHLKKLRWDHLQRISREVQRLESLERSDSWTHVDVDTSWHFERDSGLIQKVYYLKEVP